MTINLRTNYAEPNKVNKYSEYITEYRDCIMKESTSIITPSFLIRANFESVKKCNYIYVVELGRYYFVDDIILVRNDLLEFRCRVDVLSSFWDEVKINDAIIRRNANKFNTLINDGTMMEYQNPYVTVYKFDNVFDNDKLNYILLVAGSDGGE